MAGAERVQSRAPLDAGVALLCILCIALAWNGAAALTGPSGADLGHPAITETALGTFIYWVQGSRLAFARRRGPGPGAYRAFYTCGCAMCLLHIAVAFHLAHGWSHRAAWEHTRAVGGYGDGVFVNYLFAVVWLADAAWAWAAFDSYLARSRWIGRGVYGFTGFVVFNAGVVFNTGFLRAVCALFFVPVVVMAWNEWTRKGAPEAAGGRADDNPESRTAGPEPPV